MKITIIIFLSVISSSLVFAQDVVRSAIYSGTNSSTAKVQQTVGQPIAPKSQSSFLYGFQAPILIKVEVNMTTAISIYPNPVREILNIQTPTPKHFFTLYALSGNLVRKGDLLEKQGAISLQNLPKGVYLLRIYDNKDAIKAVAKVIKE
jgi:hypothetical protein